MYGLSRLPHAVPHPWRRTIHAAALALFLFTLLWLLAAHSGPAQAAQPTTIEPPGAADWNKSGESFISYYGYSVAGAGDVNQDTYDDVIVGAPLQEGGPGLTDTGKIYLYLGGAAGLSLAHSFADTGDDPGDQFGYAVGAAGDINHDGYADFLAGAPFADPGGGITDTGKVFIYFGGAGAPSAGPVLIGEDPGDQFGWAVTGAGNLNGDDFDDIVVGAWRHDDDRGKIYVYYGGPAGPDTTADFVVDGEQALDGFGVSVGGVGDLNGDGFDDLAIGAWQNDEGGFDAGKVYLFYGSASGLTLSEQSTLAGLAAQSEFGASVGSAGDVNGDGYADLAVGAYKDDETAVDAGKVYVYLGSPNGVLDTPIFTDEGEAADNYYGFAAAGAGDANGDGFGDLVVGAHQYDKTGDAPLLDAGKAYLYAGCVGGMQASPVISATGPTVGAGLGRSVAAAGDVNGDGLADTVVGAYGILGNAYVYYGAAAAGSCAGKLELLQTVSIDGFGAACSTRTAIKVPRNTTIAYCYTVKNVGPATLKLHTLRDSVSGELFSSLPITLTPGMSYTHRVTTTVNANRQNLSQWGSSTPILAPDGSPSISDLQEITATAAATSTVIITVSLDADDTDGDGIPDNVEGTDDDDEDDIPAFLDPDEQAGAKLKLVQTMGLAGANPPCAAATLTAAAGQQVTYCYTVTNTGRITLTTHALTTSAFGPLTLSAPPLGPGASYTHTMTVAASGAAVNTATWNATSVIIPPMSAALNATNVATATLTMTSTGEVDNTVYLPALRR